jgi:RNA polymerase sigma-70 factor (ECF subfamily)
VDANQTDEQLLTAYRTGRTSALEELMRRHHDDLMRFLVRLVGDRSAAEDVFQEAFLQIHLSAGTFDASRRFKPWLFTIAANKARDLLRKNSRRRTFDLSSPIGGRGGDDDGATFVDFMKVSGMGPADTVQAAERDARVQRAVQELPPTLREVLLLAYFQRMSYTQVADVLGIPLGTVKSRLHAAVAAFARQWEHMNTRKPEGRS